MSKKKISAIVALIVCAFGMNNLYAAGDCKTGDCFCGLAKQDKRDVEKFLTTCYNGKNKKVKVYDWFPDASASQKRCLTQCLGMDSKAADAIVANPYSDASKKVLRMDPK